MVTNTGLDRTLNSLVETLNDLLGLEAAGIPLPDWATINDTLDQLTKTVTEIVKFLLTTPLSLQLNVGPLLDEIVQILNMANSNDQDSMAKISIYIAVSCGRFALIYQFHVIINYIKNNKNRMK